MIEAGARQVRRRHPDHPEGEHLQHACATAPADQAVTGGVDDALRLGCSAIGFTIYPGSEYAFDQMEETARAGRRGEGGRARRGGMELSARRRRLARRARPRSISAPMPRTWRRCSARISSRSSRRPRHRAWRPRRRSTRARKSTCSTLAKRDRARRAVLLRTASASSCSRAARPRTWTALYNEVARDRATAAATARSSAATPSSGPSAEALGDAGQDHRHLPGQGVIRDGRRRRCRLYLITPPAIRSAVSPTPWPRRWTPATWRRVQLRLKPRRDDDPEAGRRRVAAGCAGARRGLHAQRPPRSGGRTTGCDGAHVGQEDTPAPRRAKMLGRATVGVTCHTSRHLAMRSGRGRRRLRRVRRLLPHRAPRRRRPRPRRMILRWWSELMERAERGHRRHHAGELHAAGPGRGRLPRRGQRGVGPPGGGGRRAGNERGHRGGLRHLIAVRSPQSPPGSPI